MAKKKTTLKKVGDAVKDAASSVAKTLGITKKKGGTKKKTAAKKTATRKTAAKKK